MTHLRSLRDYIGELEKVLETATKQDADSVLAGLPLVKVGVIDFDLIELHPFTNLERLFAAGLHQTAAGSKRSGLVGVPVTGIPPPAYAALWPGSGSGPDNLTGPAALERHLAVSLFGIHSVCTASELDARP